MTREDWDSVFDLMEDWREDHPDATDDEAYEAICQYNIDRTAARLDALKEQRRDNYTQ